MSIKPQQEEEKKESKQQDPILASTASYLRDFRKSQLKCQEGVEEEARVVYFKGKRAVEALLQSSFKSLKNVEDIKDRQKAGELCQRLLDAGYFHRSIRHSAKQLEPDSSTQEFSEDAYYTWDYQGSQTRTLLLGLLILVFALSCVMFPIWPVSLRIGVWYISVGCLVLIGTLLLITLVRWIVLLVTRIFLPPGVYIFPNLYEDVSFIESFKPVWAWNQQSAASSSVSSKIREKTQ